MRPSAFVTIRDRAWLLMLGVFLVACMALLSGPSTAAAQGGTCIDDVTGRTNVCTANDVRVAELTTEPSGECLEGSVVELNLRAKLVAGAAERYDIGMFVALDGGDARIGACYHGYLPPPLAPAASYDPNSGTGPFYHAELDEDPEDACGDLEQGVETWAYLSPIEVLCQDNDGNGFLDLAGCLSFDNQKSDPRRGTTCLGVDDTVPSTKSKCRCGTYNVASIKVIPGTIHAAKEALPDSVPEPGDDVVFTFTVQNTSQVTVTIDSLVDTVYGDLALNAASTCLVPQTLAPGASYSCSLTAPVTGAPGVQTDIFTASGTDPRGAPVSDSAMEEVTIVDLPPSIEVEKTADPTSLKEPGGEVRYTVSIANSSGPSDPVVLTALTASLYGDLTDSTNPLISESTCLLAELEPGSTYECTFKAEVSGVGGDKVTDLVTATAVDDEGSEAQASDDAQVRILALPPETGAGVAAPVVAAGMAAIGLLLLTAGAWLRRSAR